MWEKISQFVIIITQNWRRTWSRRFDAHVVASEMMITVMLFYTYF